MFALSALVPMLATSMAAPFLMQLGAVALIGVSIGIGIQLLDKFVFKRIESRVAKREDLAFEKKLTKNFRRPRVREVSIFRFKRI
ncbi:hypothetical protein SNF32_13750 [Enterococcus mundtii]|nr:hypothetical protein [Enterococcus mundtii]